jgi:hypothetical protein
MFLGALACTELTETAADRIRLRSLRCQCTSSLSVSSKAATVREVLMRRLFLNGCLILVAFTAGVVFKSDPPPGLIQFVARRSSPALTGVGDRSVVEQLMKQFNVPVHEQLQRLDDAAAGH